MNTGKKKKLNWTPYCYLIPCMLVFAVFLFYPFFKTIYLSLFLTDKMGQAKIFVGLENYMDLLTSESFRNSLKVTLIFVVIVVVGSMLLGLIAAVLCNKAFPGIRFFSTAYALPMAIASSSAAMIFQIMLHPTVGIVNKLLGLDINWLYDSVFALPAVMVMTVWKDFGYAVILFMSGLLSVPSDYYEASNIDGANAWQTFRYITLPMIRPTMVFVVITSLISYLQAYVPVMVMTEGGPGTATYLSSYLVYDQAFVKYNFGYASAIAFFILILTAVLTALSFKVTGERG